MKKIKAFFGKLPVLITSCVLAVVLLVSLICVAAAPATKGMTYKYSRTETVAGKETTFESNFKLTGKNKGTYGYAITSDGKKVASEEAYMVYVIKDGYVFYDVIAEKKEGVDAPKKEVYDKALEELKKDVKSYDTEKKLELNSDAKINAFKMTMENPFAYYGSTEKTASFKNGGAIALTVILSMLSAIAVAGAVFSVVVYFISNKQTKKIAK